VLTPPPYGEGKWKLFNVQKYPTEMDDHSGQNPEKLKELLGLWDNYVKQNGVLSQ